MPSSNKSSSAAPLIKGYLPVRLSLPNDDETFFFVKEHFASDKSTLFVANVPSVPDVSSRVLLQSLFGRFGSIERVTVIQNPRQSENDTITSTFNSSRPTFLGPIYSQGRFAHVVFVSSKEMKRALRELSNLMSKKGLPGLSLERLEIQTLADESKRQANASSDGNDSDEEEEQMEKETNKQGIHAVAERYRASCRASSARESLLVECNTIMEGYEDAEEAERRRREASKSEPDEDGFITVSYSSQSIGSKRELEQGGRRKGSKRSRKKKDPNQGLTDFYRFQTKESRKQGLQDLRKRFEQDLAKVKKMKERPF